MASGCCWFFWVFFVCFLFICLFVLFVFFVKIIYWAPLVPPGRLAPPRTVNPGSAPDIQHSLDQSCTKILTDFFEDFLLHLVKSKLLSQINCCTTHTTSAASPRFMQLTWHSIHDSLSLLTDKK